LFILDIAALGDCIYTQLSSASVIFHITLASLAKTDWLV